MTLEKALNKAKRTDEEKVGLNIKIPIGLKNTFEDICKQHGVSMTSMMLSLIEVAIDEYQENQVDLPEAMEQAAILEDMVGQFSGGNREEMIEYYKNKQELSRLQKLIAKEY